MDDTGNMHFVFGTTHELDSWMDVNAILAKAVDAKKYASKHVKPNRIKLFMDGVLEAGTGFVESIYPDGHIVSTLINAGKDKMRNTLVHVYSANQPDYKRMADHKSI